MVVHKLATRSLHHATAARGGVVGSALAEGDALGHWWTVKTYVQHDVDEEMDSSMRPFPLLLQPGVILETPKSKVTLPPELPSFPPPKPMGQNKQGKLTLEDFEGDCLQQCGQ